MFLKTLIVELLLLLNCAKVLNDRAENLVKFLRFFLPTQPYFVQPLSKYHDMGKIDFRHQFFMSKMMEISLNFSFKNTYFLKTSSCLTAFTKTVPKL